MSQIGRATPPCTTSCRNANRLHPAKARLHASHLRTNRSTFWRKAAKRPTLPTTRSSLGTSASVDKGTA